jgi:BlaI family transcriptional regulator, penicillinase repressor
MPKDKQPTGAELAILNVLWRRGPSTVRDVCEELNRERGDGAVGYTTALKLLQIMADKGLARRDESRRTHVYRAAGSEEQTQRRLVRDLLDRAFGGSAKKLILQALSSRKASAQELGEIRQVIDEMKGDRP